MGLYCAYKVGYLAWSPLATILSVFLLITVYTRVVLYFSHETTANLSVLATSEAPAFAAFTACTRRDRAYKEDKLRHYGLTREGSVSDRQKDWIKVA